MEVQSQSVLTGFSEREKGAYLAALASLATADRSASEEELDHLREMAMAAGLSKQQEDFILHSATDISGEDLTKCLDVLKTSELRFSLITDLIALAKADGEYDNQEKANVEKIATYLNVNDQQVDVLDQFVSKAAEKATGKEPVQEEISRPGFLDSLGLKNQFSNAGLNFGSTGKGIMGMLGPVILGSIATRAFGGRRRSPMGGGIDGGMLGGVLGGMLGGNNPFGMGGMGRGLSSIIGGINRSRSDRSLGGLLGRLM